MNDKATAGAPRWPKRLLIALVVLSSLTFSALLWAYVRYNGENLAELISSSISKEIKGTISVKRINWKIRAIADLALGTASPIEIDQVSVLDPYGKEVISLEKINAKIELWAILAKQSLIVKSVELKKGFALVHQDEQAGKDYIGIADAFDSGKENVSVSSKKEGSSLPLLRFDEIAIEDVDFRLAIDKTKIEIPRITLKAEMLIRDLPKRGGLFIHAPRIQSFAKGRYSQHGMSLPIEKLQIDDAILSEHSITGAIKSLIGGAPLVAKGKILDLFFEEDPALNINVDLKHIAKPLTSLTGLAFSGDSLLYGQIRGKLDKLSVGAKGDSIELDTGGMHFDRIDFDSELKLEDETLTLKSIYAKTLAGVIEGNGDFNFGNGQWNLNSKVTGVNPGLHPALKKKKRLFNGAINGRIGLSGLFEEGISGKAEVDFAYRRFSKKRGDFLPSVAGVKGQAHLGSVLVDLTNLRLFSGKNSVSLNGSFNRKQQKVNLFARLDLKTLDDYFLNEVGFNAAKSVNGKVHITGKLSQLIARGDLNAKSVGYQGLRLPYLNTQIAFARGKISFPKISSKSFGGRLKGRAAIQLMTPSYQLLENPTIDLHLRGEELKLETIAKGSDDKRSALNGRVSLNVELKGPLKKPLGVADIKATNFDYSGTRFAYAHARVGLLADRVSLYKFDMQRQGGGRLRAWNDIFFDKRLALNLRLQQMPLSVIPKIEADDSTLAGKVSGKLAIGGRISRPSINGKIVLNDTIIRGAAFGAGQIQFKQAKNATEFVGYFFGRKFELKGDFKLMPRFLLNAELTIERFPYTRVIPELKTLGDIRGVTTGKVLVKVDDKGLRWAHAYLNEQVLTLNYKSIGERDFRTIKLKNNENIELSYDGRKLKFNRFELISEIVGRKNALQAAFAVKGYLDPKESSMRVLGSIPVGLAEFFFKKRLKEVSGEVRADVLFQGPMTGLRPVGSVVINDVKAMVPRFDRSLELPQGKILLSKENINIQSLELRVGKEKLAIAGKIYGVQKGKAEDASFDMRARGDFNGRLFKLIFPEYFSDTSGSFAIELDLEGPILNPSLKGRLKLSKDKTLELKPRGLGRRIALNEGEIEINGYHLNIAKELRGFYDEGAISLTGEARFDRQELVDIYLRLKGRGIPLREPEVYNAEMNVDLVVVGDPKGEHKVRCPLSRLQGDSYYANLMLMGSVELVDFRYIQEFKIDKNLFFRPRLNEEKEPFWSGVPLLADLGLCTTIRSTGQLKVKNRYMNLGLSTSLTMTGSLSKPRIAGNVRVEEGKFSIPSLRGQYQVERGDIIFWEAKPIKEGDVDIDFATEYSHRNGTVYQIMVQLKGTISRLGIASITSQPPLDRGQIFALLATGRTTDQLRTELNTSANNNEGARAADAQVKTLTSIVTSSLLEEPLKKATGLDLVRLEVGSESVEVKACKIIGAFEICGQYEQDFLGGSMSRTYGAYRLHDYLRLVGRLERLSTRFDREQENPSRARTELKFFYPLR